MTRDNMGVKLIKIKAKEIFTRTKLPGCDWVINQYVGCEHDCLYCYAKFIARWRPPKYGKWGHWVEAKINAPELVRKNLPKGLGYMSSISDPYQPVEKKLKLTRQILESLDKDANLSIQTKSDLVLRDIELFKKFKNIEVGFTINSFKKGKSKSIFEPGSVSNEDRIEALKVLKKNGIKTFVFVSPIIPNLIDLKGIIRATKKYADYYWFEFINLRAAGKEFSEILKKEFPRSYKILMDKKQVAEFIQQAQKIIDSENIKTRGMETH